MFVVGRVWGIACGRIVGEEKMLKTRLLVRKKSKKRIVGERKTVIKKDCW